MNKHPVWLTTLLCLAAACSSAPAKPTENPGKNPPPASVDALPGLPVLYFDQYAPVKEADGRTTYAARLQVFADPLSAQPGDQAPAFLTSTPLHPPRMVQLKYRGQSTSDTPKHPFALQFSQNEPLLDLPADTEFVLQAAYFDPAVLPNWLAAQLAAEAGIALPRSRLVELWGSQLEFDTDTAWQGLYLLTEKIKRGKHRVPLKKPDLTGGYLLKFDKTSPRDTVITTASGLPITMVEPDSPTPEQAAWVKNRLDSWEAALDRPQTGDWKAGLDLTSWADQFLLNEVLGNVDGLKYSFYFSLDRGGPLKAGPGWDFDLAMGQVRWGNERETWKLAPDGRSWTISQRWYIIGSPDHPVWWKKLLRQPEFFRLVQARWQEIHHSAFNSGTVARWIGTALKKWQVKQRDGALEDWGRYHLDASLWNVAERPAQSEAFPKVVYFQAAGQNPYDLNFRWLQAWLDSRFAWLNQASTWTHLKAWAEK